jgi:hypothetical protein
MHALHVSWSVRRFIFRRYTQRVLPLHQPPQQQQHSSWISSLLSRHFAAVAPVQLLDQIVCRCCCCCCRDRLHIDPKENAVLLAEPTHNTREVREKTVQAAFEHLW